MYEYQPSQWVVNKYSIYKDRMWSVEKQKHQLLKTTVTLVVCRRTTAENGATPIARVTHTIYTHTHNAMDS